MNRRDFFKAASLAVAALRAAQTACAWPKTPSGKPAPDLLVPPPESDIRLNRGCEVAYMELERGMVFTTTDRYIELICRRYLSSGHEARYWGNPGHRVVFEDLVNHGIITPAFAESLKPFVGSDWWMLEQSRSYSRKYIMDQTTWRCYANEFIKENQE